MSNIVKTLGANRRDCIWFFILGALVVGYAIALMNGGQFLMDSNAPLIPLIAVACTIIIIGGVFLAVGGTLLIYGMKVLVEGGSSGL